MAEIAADKVDKTANNKILVVDDDPINRMVLEELLEDEPYVLAMAESGEQALEVATQFGPDLILLDVMMPGLNGYETCQEFRKLESRRSTKIVIVSAKAMVSERLQGYEAGANDYISKPFNHSQLMAKIELLLRLKAVEESDWFEPRFRELMNEDLWCSILEAEDADDSGGVMTDDVSDEVVRRCSRYLELLDRLDEICELKRPETQLSTAPVDLVAVIKSAVRDSPFGGEIQCKTPDSVTIEGNAEKLSFVAKSLLASATECGSPDEPIVVEILDEAESVLLLVSSRGEGIDAQLLPVILDELSHENWASRERGGGLSLPLCRAIVDRHGGTIEVRSEPNGETCFTLRFKTADA